MSADALAALIDELRHHRADGYATTTDVLRLAEVVEALMADDERPDTV